LGFNLDTDQPLTGEVGQIPDTNGDGNGDFAFDATGNLWIVTGTSVMRTETPLPTTGGTGAQLAVNTWAVVDGLQGALGSVAVGPDGYVYAGSATTVYKINPSEPNQVTQLPSTDTGDFSDMASCSAMNVLTVQKNLPNGRASSGDQFNLNIAYDGSIASTATTTGSDSGMQSDAAELAVLGALPSGGYDISETPAAGTSMSNYSSSYECTAMGADPNGPAGTLVPIDGWSASGTGTSGTIQFPSYPSGATDAQWATGIQVTCTFTNTLQQPITLTKTASPTTVQNVGDTVNYTFNVTNSGDAPLSDVNVTDPMTAAGLTLTGCDNLGTLQPGDSATCTGTYAATTADFNAGSIKNTATATGTLPDDTQVTGEGSATVTATRSTAVNCSTLYAIQPSGNQAIYSVDMTTGARTTLFNLGSVVGGLPTSTTVYNGLAIDPRTHEMYAVSQISYNQGSATIYEIDPESETATVVGNVTFPTPVPANSGVVMGAISDSGILYFAYIDNSDILHILGFNIDAGQPLNGEVGWVQLTDYNGDFAFDATGNLWIVTGNQVLRTLTPLSTTGGTGGQIAAETWATVSGMGGMFDAVAVGPDGYIYAGSGSARNGNGYVYKINPSEPQQVTQLPSADGGDFSDFASCSAMNVLTIQKNLPNGRAASGDQFNLNIAYDGSTAATATTTGTDSGMQNDAAELAVLGALPSGGYDISETPATGTSMSNYSSSYECTAMGADPSGPAGTLVPITGWSASGTGTSGTIQFPSYPATATDAQWATGIQVTCTFINTLGQPGISVKKTASPTTVQNVGDEVTYTFNVTNSGDAPLSDVNVTDSMPGLVIDPSCANLGSLDVGASTSCTATYTVIQADIDRGSIANTATASGTPPTGGSVSGTGDTTVTVTGLNPSVSLTKTATPKTITAVGDVVTYTFAVTNNGNQTLTNAHVTDPMTASGLTLTGCDAMGTLAPGASTSCTGTYTVTQTDLDNGGVSNTATATATPPTGPDITGTGTADVTTNDNPHLKLVKTADKTSFQAVGDIITYTFKVTNDGNLTLTNVAVNDPLLGSTPPAGCTWATLAPGASVSCTAQYAVTQTDLDNGGVTNAATVTGNPPTGGPTDGTDTVTVPAAQNTGMTVVKTADKTNYNAVGDVITYTFAVTNNGNVTLTGVNVTDPMTGLVMGPTCANLGSLAAGASTSCTATYTVTQADLDRGSIANTATATGTPPTGPAITGTDTLNIDSNGAGPAISVAKSASPASVSAVGDKVTYTIDVTNTGGVTLTDVNVADAMPGLVLDPTCTGLGSLAPGQATACTATYTVTQADLDRGSIANTATASGTPPTGGPISGTGKATVPVAGLNPSVSLAKTATPKIISAVGDIVTYTFNVTNSGNVTLTNVKVNDPMPGLMPDPSCASLGTLAPGASTSCTATYTVTQADLDNGGINNTATATATPPSGPDITGSGTADVTANDNPQLNLVKTADKTSFSAVGDVITYTFNVTNTGNVTLTGVAVNDPMLGSTPPAGCTWATLDAGASVSCTATYSVTQADLDKGSVTNAASVAGNPPTGGPTDGTDTVTVPADDQPGLTLKKTADKTSFSAVGDSITYTFDVTNTGNVTLTDVAVNDPMLGSTPPAGCTWATIAAGISESCTATYAVTQADLDKGSVTNAASVAGNPPTGGPTDGTDTVTVPADDQPGVSMAKTADKTSFSAVGDIITYTFKVTNTGNVTLTDVAVNDPMLGSTPPAGCTWATLDAGASVSCTATYSVTQADLDKGSVTNAASVAGNPPTGGPTDGGDTVTVPADDKPGLTLKKTADTTSFSAVGDVITYTFNVTNTGNVTLTDVAVNDPMLGSTPPAGCTWATIAAGISESCTAKYAVTQADLDKGSVTNAATVAGNPPTGGPTDGTDTVTVPATQEPSLTILKTADTPKMPAVGGVVTYTFLVTNNGNVTVQNVVVTDPMAGLTLNGCSIGTLAPGASATCTGTYTVTQADVDHGSIVNTATVTGDAPSGDKPTDDSTVTLTSDGAPSIQLVKTADITGVAKAGDTMTYTFDITNTGNLTLTGVTVTDLMPGLTLDGCDFGTLAPGQKVTCTGTYVVSQPDMDAGFVTNTATAAGQPPTGDQVTNHATVTTNLPTAPGMSVVKSVDTTDVTQAGQILTYTFVAKNTGNVTLDNVNVTDEDLPGIVLDGCDNLGVLAPNAEATCTGAYTVTAADLDGGSLTNVAIGHATTPPTPGGPTPPPQIPDVPSNPVTVTDQDATIGNFVWDDLNGNGIQDPGEPGIAGVSVTLVRPNADGTSQTYQTTTDASGHYTLSAPPSGATGYTVTFQIPTGMVATAPNQGTPGNDSVIDATGTATGVTGVGGQANNDIDAGFYTPSNISGVAWTDSNHDGIMDDGEPLAPGVTLTISGTDGTGTPVSQTTTTDATGAYQFLVPPSGGSGYVVTVTTPANTALTDQGKGTKGTSPTIGSDVDPATGTSGTITVTSGDATVVNAGLVGSNLVVTKTANPSSGTAVKPGDTVTYQLTFSNPAPAAPAAVAYVDDLSGVIDDATVAMAGIGVTPPSSCTDPANAVPGACQLKAAGMAVTMSPDGSKITISGTLQPGTVLALTYRATVIGSLMSGDHSLVNTLTSTGPGPKEPPIVTENPVSQILLVKEGKVLDGKSGTEGDTIAYTFTIKNVGTTTLHDVQLTDGHAGLSAFVFGSWPGDTGVLTPGQSVTATALYQVTDADVLAGTVVNNATVAATDDQGNNVTCDSSSSVPLAAHPSIVFAKTVSAADGSTVVVGDQLGYTFTVTNTGDITLNNVRVTDPMAGLSDIVFNWPGQPGVLSPGQSVVAKATYQVTAADVAAGHVNNTAISYADIPGWQPGDRNQPPSSVPSPEVSATASATYTISPETLLVQTGGNLSDTSWLAALALALLLAGVAALLGAHRARERGWCSLT